MTIKETNPSGGCHVVILGAGASIAATIRDPEEHGLKLPSMNNLPDVVGLHGCLNHFPQELIKENFEATYSNIAEYDPNNPYLKVMNDLIYSYFNSMLLPLKPTIYDYLIMSLRDKDKKYVCITMHGAKVRLFPLLSKKIAGKVVWNLEIN